VEGIARCSKRRSLLRFLQGRLRLYNCEFMDRQKEFQTKCDEAFDMIMKKILTTMKKDEEEAIAGAVADSCAHGELGPCKSKR
jgi:hypothetical protein